MKDKIVEAVQSLPADATIEDAMERLLFLAKMERGPQQATGGATIPLDQANVRCPDWHEAEVDSSRVRRTVALLDSTPCIR